MTGRLALLLVALAAFGCEPDPDVEPLPCRNLVPGVTELGIGGLASGFLPVSDGDDIEIIFGPQGQHMAFAAARVSDMEPAQAGGIGTTISLAFRHEGELVGGVVSRGMQPSRQQDEITDFAGVRAVFTAAEIDELYNEMVDVEIIVSDGCGRELAAERPLRLVSAEVD